MSGSSNVSVAMRARSSRAAGVPIRRVEAETIRSYFKVAPGEHLDAAKSNV
jgi:hypothetical protein